MTMSRACLTIMLLAGCTKAAAPPQPPADDEVSPPPPSDEPEEDLVEIDPSILIEGPLTEAQVQQVAQDNFTDIQKCFDAALVRMDSENLTGAIAVRMEVDSGGPVTDASVEASNFDDDETPTCIVDEVKTWSFPKSKKPSTVTYPFFLRSY